VSAFIGVFSTTNSGSESKEGRREPRVGFDGTLENLVMTGAYLSSSVERVALWKERREPRDARGLVMRLDD